MILLKIYEQKIFYNLNVRINEDVVVVSTQCTSLTKCFFTTRINGAYKLMLISALRRVMYNITFNASLCLTVV